MPLRRGISQNGAYMFAEHPYSKTDCPGGADWRCDPAWLPIVF
jgi:hypothetical protein